MVVFIPRDSDKRAARTTRPERRFGRRLLALTTAWLLLVPLSGCAGGYLSKKLSLRRDEVPTGPVDSMVLRAGQLEMEAIPDAGTAAADFEGARRLYQEGQYGKAESIFHRLARDKKNSLTLNEEALYYEADCARLQGSYPRAAELYNLHLQSYPAGRNTAKARQRLFDIANFWLDDTRAYMEAYREKREGKRWLVMPVSFVNIEKAKPFFDCKGHALRMLEQVYITDPTGPLAEKALFYLGTVKFFEEEYRDADHFFGELVRHHPNGQFAPQALELSIVCKQMATGGSEYDGRLIAEAREMIDMAWKSYPELAHGRKDFLVDQLHSIQQQQADKDWKIAEFYRRIGKPGSAHMMYEIVRRRYHGTEYARKAEERMREINAEHGPAKDGPPPQGSSTPMPSQQFTPGQPLSPVELGPPPQRLPALPAGNLGRSP